MPDASSLSVRTSVTETTPERVGCFSTSTIGYVTLIAPHRPLVSHLTGMCDLLTSIDPSLTALVRTQIVCASDGLDVHAVTCDEVAFDAPQVLANLTLPEIISQVSSCLSCDDVLGSRGLAEDTSLRLRPLLDLATALKGQNPAVLGAALRYLRINSTNLLVEEVVTTALLAAKPVLDSHIPSSGVVYAVSRPVFDDFELLVQGVHDPSGATLLLLEDHQCPTPLRSLSPMYLQSDVTREELLQSSDLFFSLLRTGLNAPDAWQAATTLA